MLFLFCWKLASCNLKSLPNSSSDSVCSRRDKQNCIITYTTTSTIWRVIYLEQQKLIQLFSLYVVIENSRKFAKIWFEVAKIATPKYCVLFFLFLECSDLINILHKLTLMVLLCAFTSPLGAELRLFGSFKDKTILSLWQLKFIGIYSKKTT